MTKKLLVRDLMTAHVDTVGPNLDLLAARDLMWRLEIRHMPVVDDSGKLCGLISQRDLLRELGRAAVEPAEKPGKRQAATARTVGDVMTRDVETVPPSLDLRRAATLIYGAKLGCLPVLERSKLIGILTESDFVRSYAEGTE